jgi:hypothetical protein
MTLHELMRKNIHVWDQPDFMRGLNDTFNQTTAEAADGVSREPAPMTKRCWCCSEKKNLLLLWHRPRDRVATPTAELLKGDQSLYEGMLWIYCVAC